MKHSSKAVLILAVWIVYAQAQTTIPASPKEWEADHCTVHFDNGVIHVDNKSGQTAFLWARDMELQNGTIELDIRGRDLSGASFVGVAFHAVSSDIYDAVYFRPFNFRNQEKKDRAVQYVSKPEFEWDLLRERFPGKYEHAIIPDTDPNEWFHVTIKLSFPAVEVYVNGSKEPTLGVQQLGQRRSGRVALWVDSEEGWFRNVTIEARE